MNPLQPEEFPMTALERLKYIALDPVDIRRNFLLLTRFHFSDSVHYGPMTELSDLVYTRNPTTNNTLSIELSFINPMEEGKNAENLPAIRVHGGDWVFKKADLGQHAKRTDAGEELARQEVTTAVRIVHMARSPEVAAMLATQTVGFYGAIGRDLIHAMNLTSFDIAQMSNVNIMTGEDKQNVTYRVDVLINLTFNCIWSSLIESKRIKTISFSALKQL